MTDEMKVVTGDQNLNAKTDKMTKEDEQLLATGAAPAGKIPEGFEQLTPEMLKDITKNLSERKAAIDDLYPKLVEQCPYDVRLAVACWTISHILAHAREGGTYRYLIYERLGFGPDAYAPLQWAGALDVSNEFDLTEEGRADRRKEEVEVFARALKKFAPDLAAELVKRWTEAKAQENAALADFLQFLRGQSNG